MEVRISEDWKELLAQEFEKEYFANLVSFVKQEYSSGQIFPPAARIFSAFDSCPLDKLKVVIIGQDPYHGDGQANGLSFSVGDGVSLPPSLVNIYKELLEDLGIDKRGSGDLSSWAEQGVLLLNSVLTVRAHQAASHQGRGWEQFTDAVIGEINRRKEGIVYILWGSYAQKKAKAVDSSRNYVISSVHPSPLSSYRGFFGSKPFSKANDYLVSIGKEPISW